MSWLDGRGQDAEELPSKTARTHLRVLGSWRAAASNCPGAIIIAGRPDARPEEGADYFSCELRITKPEVQVDALAISSAVTIMINVRAEREIFAVRNADVIYNR